MASLFDSLPIWRPVIPDSIDGEPLSVSLSDLVTTFPYERLPTDSSFVSFLLRPEAPFLLVAAYIASESILTTVCKTLGTNGKSNVFFAFVVAHNFLLAAFSAIVLVNSWPIVLHHLAQNGMEATFCDQDGSLWSNGLGVWATIFYISKYYEFVDTYVLIIKGKKPSFLQLYHHSGVVITMWGGVVSHGAWILIVVLLNSGIHTLMYTYFLIKTLYPKKEIKAAKYLTMAQIVQFITGITYTLPIHVLGERCDSSASRLVCLFIELYAVGLILLFAAFAKKKYKKKE